MKNAPNIPNIMLGLIGVIFILNWIYQTVIEKQVPHDTLRTGLDFIILSCLFKLLDKK
jgi:hypothetical protein